MSRHRRQQRRRARALAARTALGLVTRPRLTQPHVRTLADHMAKRTKAAIDRNVDALVLGQQVHRAVERSYKADEVTLSIGGHELAVMPETVIAVKPMATPTELLYAAVNANPGLSTMQLAKHTGTTGGVASTTLRRMYNQGKINREDGNGPRGGFTWHPAIKAEV